MYKEHKLFQTLARLNNVVELAEKAGNSSALSETCYSFIQPSSNDINIKIPKNSFNNLRSLSLMHIAAFYDSLEVLMYLNQHIGIPLDIKSAQGYNPLHYACLGDAQEVAAYIMKNAKVNSPQYTNIAEIETDTQFQYLYCAVCGNSPDIIELLIKNGCRIDTFKNKANKPIQHAIKCKHIKCLETLLIHSPKRNFGENIDMNDLSPLMLAILNNEPSAVPLLLQIPSCKPEQYTLDGVCALYLVCFIMSSEKVETCRLIVDYMIGHSIDVDLPSHVQTKAAVHWICLSRSAEIAKIILSANIDVNRLDGQGHIGPFYLLDAPPETQGEVIPILDMLFQRGIDINYSTQKELSLLGHFLNAITKRADVVEWLLAHGANPDAPAKLTNLRGSTPTCRMEIERLAKMKKEFKDIADTYLKK